MEKTFKIPACNIGKFESKFEALQKKAAKIGMPVPTYTKEAGFVKETLEGGVNVEFPVFFVKVSGEAPKFAGLTLVSALDSIRAEDGTLMVISRTVPGETLPSSYYEAGWNSYCDHCGADRYRKTVYVLRHEDGTTLQVGSTCIKDFLGNDSPEHVAQQAEFLLSIGSLGDGEFMGSGGGYDAVYSMDDILSLTSTIISKRGWISSKRAKESGDYGMATHCKVSFILNPPSSRYEQAFKDWKRERDANIPTEANLTEAEDAKTWILEQDPKDNEYLHNLKVLVLAGRVPERSIPLACSLVASYQRENERLLQYRALYKEEYFGEVGKRYKGLTLCVMGAIGCETMYGESVLYKFRDEEGRPYTWFASGSNHGINQGDVLRVDATVKRHETYKGKMATSLSRVTVKETLSIEHFGEVKVG